MRTRWLSPRRPDEAELTLIDASGANLGRVPRETALASALEAGLDLVAMTPFGAPLVCRLLPPEPEDHRAEGKKFHDPLAACCAINEAVGSFVEVELYRDPSGWGARRSAGSNTWIIVDPDRERFIETLLSSAAITAP